MLPPKGELNVLLSQFSLWCQRRFFGLCFCIATCELIFQQLGIADQHLGDLITKSIRSLVFGIPLVFWITSTKSPDFFSAKAELRVHAVCTVAFGIFLPMGLMRGDSISDIDISKVTTVVPFVTHMNILMCLLRCSRPEQAIRYALALVALQFSIVAYHKDKRADVLPIYVITCPLYCAGWIALASFQQRIGLDVQKWSQDKQKLEGSLQVMTEEMQNLQRTIVEMTKTSKKRQDIASQALENMTGVMQDKLGALEKARVMKETLQVEGSGTADALAKFVDIGIEAASEQIADVTVYERGSRHTHESAKERVKLAQMATDVVAKLEREGSDALKHSMDKALLASTGDSPREMVQTTKVMQDNAELLQSAVKQGADAVASVVQRSADLVARLEQQALQERVDLLESAFDATLMVNVEHRLILESSARSDRLFLRAAQGLSFKEVCASHSVEPFVKFLDHIVKKAIREESRKVVLDNASDAASSCGRNADFTFQKHLATFIDANSAEFDCEVRAVYSMSQTADKSKGLFLGIRCVGEKRTIPKSLEPAVQPSALAFDAVIGECLGQAWIDENAILYNCSSGWSEVFQGDVEGEKFHELIFPTDVKLFQTRLGNIGRFEATLHFSNKIRLRLVRPEKKNVFEAAYEILQPDEETKMQPEAQGRLKAVIAIYGPVSDLGSAKEFLARTLTKAASVGTRSNVSSRSSGSSRSSRHSERRKKIQHLLDHHNDEMGTILQTLDEDSSLGSSIPQFHPPDISILGTGSSGRGSKSRSRGTGRGSSSSFISAPSLKEPQPSTMLEDPQASSLKLSSDKVSRDEDQDENELSSGTKGDPLPPDPLCPYLESFIIRRISTTSRREALDRLASIVSLLYFWERPWCPLQGWTCEQCHMLNESEESACIFCSHA